MADQDQDKGGGQANQPLAEPEAATSDVRLGKSDPLKELSALAERILDSSQKLWDQAERQPGQLPLTELCQIDQATQQLSVRLQKMAESAFSQQARTSLDWSPPASSSSPSTPVGVPDETETILVVDDNDHNREVLGGRLRKRGFEVVLASNGKEALEKIGSQKIDLVMLDIMMPEMDGMQVLQAIRKETGASDLPVVMSTSCDDAEDMVRALRLGANDYVSKTLDFAVVLARIEIQLMVKRANDQIRRLNRRLEETQDRISRLLDSSSLAMLDLAGWARWIGDDIARSVGARVISVWVLEQDEMTLLTGDEANPPSLQEIQAASQGGRLLITAEQTTMPIRSLSGDVLGGLVISGDKAVWDETELALMRSFAHQVGSALELKRAHQGLANITRKSGGARTSLPPAGDQPLKVCRQCRRCYEHTKETCTDDGTPLDPTFTVPYRLGDRYRVRRLLGAGGIGAVFEARDERLDRNVAIKVVRVEHAVNMTLRARFEKEARILAKIASPGVTTVYDSGQLQDGSHYIVMERLYGADLEHVLHKYGRGRPSQVSQLLRQAGQALSAAHKAGLIHRDLKPGNLFLVTDPRGLRVKILDFGLAKDLGGRTQLTCVGEVIGTPAFMSPEQMLSKPIDARSDIYSFAAVGYEALTNFPAAPGTAQLELYDAVVVNMPPPPSAMLPGLPEQIDRAFLWALQKDPANRPASVEEWVDSFVDVLDTLPNDCSGWPEGRELLAVGDPSRESEGTGSAGSTAH